MLTDAFQLQIELDRVVSAGAHGNFFPPTYTYSGDVGICCRVNRQTINAALSERLTTHVKGRRMQIEQVWEDELLCLCLSSAALTFCPCSSYSVVCESQIGNDSL